MDESSEERRQTLQQMLDRLEQRTERSVTPSPIPLRRRARPARLARPCPVQFERVGDITTAVCGNISAQGLFLRTTAFLPVGDVVPLTVGMPDGSAVKLRARVVHVLGEKAARALGRCAGMGFEFVEPGEGRTRLQRVIERILRERFRGTQKSLRVEHVLVADRSRRLLERLSTALGEAGFEVEAVSDGGQAYAAALARPPDLLLCADELPVLDGWSLLQMLALTSPLARVPVVLMSDDASDFTRLKAYRKGVKDFLHKPFTDEELCIRLQRVVGQPVHNPGVRGTLDEIGIGTLLSLLEVERKSGVLQVRTSAEMARLFLQSGRVVKVDACGDDAVPRDKLFRVLDLSEGEFEFTGCEVGGEDEIGLSTQVVLLEHARLRDEEEHRRRQRS